jgi:fatty-acyl-CoA synthase
MNENLATLWESAADEVPDRPAIIQGETVRTWGEFEERAARLAAGLAKLGVGRGTLVAIDLYNCPQNLEAVFAAYKLRAVPFNINYRFRENELVHLFTDSQAGVVVFDHSLGDRVAAAAETAATGIRLVQVNTDDPAAAVAPGAVEFEQLVAENDPAPRIDRDGEDELIVYTGGTTGYPKGVVWAHNQFGQPFGQMMQPGNAPPPPETMDDYTEALRTREHRVSLTIQPLMHMTGFAGSNGTLSSGGTVVFCESRSLSPKEILTLVEKHRIKQFGMIGDAYAKPILEELDRARDEGKPYDLSSVETIGNVGMVWSAHLKKAFFRHGDFVIRDGIGSTEGSGFASIVTGPADEVETAKFKLGPNARVIGDDGADVVPGSGQVGFLAVAGRLPKRYLNDPERSAKTWPTIDGVRYSMPGDMATVEADGTITLLGRGSEVINSGGEKIFVEEVEQAIITHPAVREVLVVGVPDERWGSRVTAVISLEQGAELTEQEVRDWVGQQLSDHKRPRQVVFVDEVPRGANNKADRVRAKELAAQASVAVG